MVSQLSKEKLQEVSLAVANKKKEMTFRKFGETTVVDGKKIGVSLMLDLPAAVHEMNQMRTGFENFAPVDISFGEYARERWGFSSLSEFLNACGVDPAKVTIEQLFSLPNLPAESRHIVPEVFMEPIRTGFRRPAFFNDLILDTVNIPQMSVTVPQIKMADATMQVINEGESIPVGTISFGSKQARARKVARGFSLTDEVVMFSTIQMLAPFLEDLGVRMNMSQNAEAVRVAINGDGASDAAAVIGVKTVGEFSYRDFVYAHAGFDNIGRSCSVSVLDKNTYADIMDMPEVKGLVGNNQLLRVSSDVKTLSNNSMRIHSIVPTGKILFIDKQYRMRRLMVKPLMVESDRIVSRQTNQVFASAILGFTSIMRDGAFIMDNSLDIATNDFPTWMSAAAYEQEGFRE